MKTSIDLRKIFEEPNETKKLDANEGNVNKIDINKVKKLTINKIQQDKKKKILSFSSNCTKIACALIVATLITTGSTYAFSNEGFKNLIVKLIGIQQTKILMVGEAITNKDYELKVHEIITDSYVGHVIVSIEALRDKSKEDFDNYHIDLKHIGSGFGLGELDEYRETYTKYYEITFSGATYKDCYNDGKLQFSVEGMKRAIEVSLSPTVERIDMDITKDNSNDYKYKFNKFHLSEIGIALEGEDTRNSKCENWYNIELLFIDGTKKLLKTKMNESVVETYIPNNPVNPLVEVKRYDNGSETTSQNSKVVSGKSTRDTFINGDLLRSSSVRLSGDRDNYVIICIMFSKDIPLDTIKQVIINDTAYATQR
jgi:hypothetical protein